MCCKICFRTKICYKTLCETSHRKLVLVPVFMYLHHPSSMESVVKDRIQGRGYHYSIPNACRLRAASKNTLGIFFSKVMRAKDEWTYSFGRFRVFEGYDFRNLISDQCASVLTMLQYTTAPYMIQKRIVEYE